MEDSVSDTNNRAVKWRSALHETIDTISHGRERFIAGNSVAKRDVLLSLGSNPVIRDGILKLTPHEWLVPIQKELPALKLSYEGVR